MNKCFIVVLILLQSCSFFRSINPDKDRDFTTDPVANPIETTLDSILKDPEGYIGVSVIFDAVFNKVHEDIWSPVLTKFTPEHYISFSVWLPTDEITQKNTANIVETLFVRKTSKHIQGVFYAERYQNVTIKGKVANAFNNLPWIEVYEIVSFGKMAKVEHNTES
ncbi:MAG: hypothetical protein HY606_14015, partial [Planctomycetes bacterium]|nr:hypothetical protein [Planctomycetota bacterium]